MINSSIDKYNLNILPDKYLFGEQEQNDKLINYFWYKNHLLNNKLIEYCNKNLMTDNILEIGAGNCPFSLSTHFVDCRDIPNVIKMDIDYDKIPFDNNYFNFIYSRHTLEDIQNPYLIFTEMCRVSPRGFIETPSPLVEITKGVDISSLPYCGYIHHRYIVWSSIESNILHFLPKYPIIEYINFNIKNHLHILNNYPLYWNNYYIWDENNKPNIIIYRNGINMDIKTDYTYLLEKAITESIKYTSSLNLLHLF